MHEIDSSENNVISHQSVIIWGCSSNMFFTTSICLYNLLNDMIYFHQLGPLGRVGHRVAMSVCMYVCVCLSVIVDNGQSIRFFVFLQKIECVDMVLRILNLEGHQHGMIDSKVMTILTTFFVHD